MTDKSKITRLVNDSLISLYYLYLLPVFAVGLGLLVKGVAPTMSHLIFLVPAVNWLFYIAFLFEETILGFGLLIPCALAGVGLILIKREQEKEVARKVAELHHKTEQDGYQNEMIVLCDNSITIFESIPEHLKSAEEYLNQAELEFLDGAFAPFWDAIEKAAKMLGHFDEGVQNIKNNLSKYNDLIRKYEDVPPLFPLARRSVEKLSVGTSTAERMQEIVRTAQRNSQFATIYEQRKTNQILVAGFTNLAQELDRMTWKITESIDTLADSVDSMASTLNESLSAIHSRLSDMAEVNIKHNSEVVKLDSDRVVREKRALEMLDNIQHHRRPSI